MHALRLALVFSLALAATSGTAQPLEGSYLYRMATLRAAPGDLLELIDALKDQTGAYAGTVDDAPIMMRHSQGDHWDVLVLYPMASYAEYYSPARMESREPRASTDQQHLNELAAFQEDVFVFGPPLEAVRRAFEGAAFFHVEMFEALPGQHNALVEQRRMENEYLRNLERPQNFIFVKSTGAPVDVVTIGFYRDLRHFAESADLSIEDEEAAARAAGFESVYAISPYLRSLIREHHDTLAVRVR